MKASKAAKPKTSVAPGGKASDNAGNVEALFLQIAEKMDGFENCEVVDELKPFDYPGVIKLLDLVIAIEPGNRKALNYKGMMLIGAGENALALKCFDAILKANPVDKECLNNKGIALYGLGKDDEALKYVDKAIELDRRYADAIMNKAVILHSMGRDAEAEQLAARARAMATING